MPSLRTIFGSTLQVLGKVDEVKAVVEVANAGRKMLAGKSMNTAVAEDSMKKNPPEARLEAALLELLGSEADKPRDEVRAYVRENFDEANDRIQEFLQRKHDSEDANESKLENRWEEAAKKVWFALQDGFGVKQQQPPPAPQQGKRGQQQQPSQPQPTGILPDSALLHRLFLVTTGIKALARDEQEGDTEGDAVIVRTIERLEALSIGQKVADATTQTLGGLTSFLEGINDELDNVPPRTPWTWGWKRRRP